MTTQVFRGRTLLDARNLAVNALGKSAVVLTTRKVPRRSLTGLLGAVDIEIAAAVTGEVPAPEPAVGRGPFAASAYESARESAPRDAVALLRSELRAEIRAMKVAMGRSTPSATDDVAVELAEMRAVLEQLAPASRACDKIAALLRARGIEGPAATRLMRTLRANKDEGASLDDRLRDAVSEIVMASAWPLSTDGRFVVAAVGPTGVGKTTTIAKLAARAKIDGKSVTLVTCDTFRVGGIEQIRRYAELLGMPYEVANDADGLALAISRARTDIVMVDTSGRELVASASERMLSANGFAAARECRAFARHVLLCVPAATRAVDATRIVKSFAATAPTALAITKLDETDTPSGLVHAAFAAKLPLSVLCAGQRVPEDITPATMGGVLDAVIPKRQAQRRPHECNGQSS